MADLSVENQEPIPNTALWLGLAGAVPFVASALGSWLDPDLARRGIWLTLGLAYGAIILSFLGGIRWGVTLSAPLRERELALSVLPSLAGWAALILPSAIGVCLLIGGFLMQALWDVTSVHTGRLPQWFGRLRMILTTIVVVSLLAILGKLAF